MQNQKAFGSLYSTSHCGSCNRYSFNKASSAGGEYQMYSLRTDVNTFDKCRTVRNANKWYQALDLEIINSLKETLYTGISTKGSTNTLKLNVTRQLNAVVHPIHFYSCFDIIIEFDYANELINVIQ